MSDKFMIQNLATKFVLVLFGSLPIVSAYSMNINVGSRQILIPSFSNLEEMHGNEHVMKWADALIEPDVRLLSVFLEKETPENKNPVIERYIFVTAPKQWEHAILSGKDFQEGKKVLKKSTSNLSILSKLANSRVSEDEQKISNALEAKMENMSIGAPVLIEVQRDEELGYGYTYAARFQANVDGQLKTWLVASCNNTLVIKGKLLIINVYGAYRTAADLQWVRNTCREFSNGVISAN